MAKPIVFTVATTLSAVCVLVVVLSVVLTRPVSVLYSVSYTVSDEGNIIWKKDQSVKLIIKSNLLRSGATILNSHDQVNNSTLSCDESQFKISRTIGDANRYQCYEVTSARGEMEDCSKNKNLQVKDCFMLKNENFDDIYWYGGSESYWQVWPINSRNPSITTEYISTAVPWRFGNVLESYWLSSTGSFVFVPSSNPLHVTIKPNSEICLESRYSTSNFRGSSYSQVDFPGSTVLKYTICVADNLTEVHKVAIENKIIPKPTSLPDLRMMQKPIWSTWARYKENINQTIIESFANEIIENGFSNSQLEIDDGYEEEYGDFRFSEAKFPDATSMISRLKNKGFRVTTWVTPFMNRNSRNHTQGRLQGYFVQDSSSSSPVSVVWWNGLASIVDFTKPEAANWYVKILENSKSEFGIDSFKFDAGEAMYLPQSSKTTQTLFNPCEYTKLYTDAAIRAGGEMMEMRSAWKTQGYPIYMRIMDKASRWGEFNGLKSIIPTALQFSIIGYPFILPDMIGGNIYGLREKPDREMYIRWIELTAFLPVMQFSITPWDYDPEVVTIAKKYVSLHENVLYGAIIEAAEVYVQSSNSILSPISPLWAISSVTETEAFTTQDQFLIGQKYMVAPILQKGQRERSIYLPRGNGELPYEWLDMMNEDKVIVEVGGKWLRDYNVDLDQISWWKLL